MNRVKCNCTMDNFRK